MLVILREVEDRPGKRLLSMIAGCMTVPNKYHRLAEVHPGCRRIFSAASLALLQHSIIFLTRIPHGITEDGNCPVRDLRCFPLASVELPRFAA